MYRDVAFDSADEMIDAGSRPRIKVLVVDNGVLIRAGVQVCSVVVRLTAGITLVENNSKAPSNVDSPVHENMALLIVNEILKNPSGTLMRYIASRFTLRSKFS